MKTPFLSLVLLSIAISGGEARSEVAVYLSPNGIESAEDSGIMGVTPQQIFTEDFASAALGNFTDFTSAKIGAHYTSAGGADVSAGNIFGGNAEGNFLGISGSSSINIALASPAQYFGFYFTAGDDFNSLEIYSGADRVFQFSTAALIDRLPNDGVTTVTAINGSQYLGSNYYGQPGSGANGGQPYAYLHFVTTGSDTFDRLVLYQSNVQSSGAIFENDNHSILAVRPALPDSLVSLPELGVPEPSTPLLLGLVGASAFSWRRRKGKPGLERQQNR
ncbi:MAG: PEP-CTERM sorting domain-containing protein [Verrucomicrobiaceae bacterium]|nr:MAG: PEP-CTERM sorting domain-containing protein [Verrucomicrobiaceae bacterium]